MPTTGRHSSFRRNYQRGESSDNQLYPQLPPGDIEMVDIEEQRASLKHFLKLHPSFKINLKIYQQMLVQKWRPVFERVKLYLKNITLKTCIY